MKNHLVNALEIAENKAKYDENVKKILADKNILAWILKETTEEFKEYSIEKIKDCIEEPELAAVPVYPGRQPERITGLNTEDKVPNEGTVTYDIRFTAVTPGKERIKLIINIEAQKSFYPGYDLVTRCIFYLARQLSAQLDTEFTANNYDDIKKVYSIWVCMDTPKSAADTITRYGMEKTCMVGQYRGKARYDLMTGVVICLGKERNTEDGSLLRLLGTLLSQELKPEEKEEILREGYQIETSVQSKEVLNSMCNLSDLIEEKGIEKGMEKGIEKGIEKGMEQGRAEMMLRMYKSGMAEGQIAEIAGISVEAVEALLKNKKL